MTANQLIAATLIAVTAALTVCLCVIVAKPAMSEEVCIGPPPRWRRVKHRHCRNRAPWRSRGHKIRSVFPRPYR